MYWRYKSGSWGSWYRIVNSGDIDTLKASFQDGCSTIATAITNNGVTTASNATPTQIATNINKLVEGKYKYFNKTCEMSEGTWSGVTLKDTAFVHLATSSTSSSFIYYHNLNLDVSKIKFASGRIIEPSYGIRIPRGVSSNGYSNYAFYNYFEINGSSSISGSESINGALLYDDVHAYTGLQISSTNLQSTVSTYSSVYLWIYPNYIQMNFNYAGIETPMAIRSTTPKFDFTIIYE